MAAGASRAALRLAALALAGVAGCTVAIPEGTLRCAATAECPGGWSCVAGVCWSQPPDAGPPDAPSGLDAGRDAGRDAPRIDAGTDAGPPDAPDGGPDAPPLTVVAVDCGATHTCAVRSDGRVYCWGSNDSGELGDGVPSTIDATLPRPVAALDGLGVSSVSLGASHACALAPGARLWCWGSNAQGQLGDDTVSMLSALPVEVALPSAPIAIDAGGRFTCALTADARVFCWGEDNNGEMGDGSAGGGDVRRPTPVTMPAGRTASAISAGSDHACALLDDASVACWGWNGTGQIGTGTAAGDVATPTLVVGLGGAATRVWAIGYHTCAALESEELRCWGRNNSWQLGQNEVVGPFGSPPDLPTPTSVPLPGAVTLLAGGDILFLAGGHTCAAGPSLDLHCWGWNARGQVGTASAASDVRAPAPVTTLARVEALAGGGAHTCAVASGELWCWGWNDDGQLGIASMAEARAPMRVMGLP